MAPVQVRKLNIPKTIAHLADIMLINVGAHRQVKNMAPWIHDMAVIPRYFWSFIEVCRFCIALNTENKRMKLMHRNTRFFLKVNRMMEGTLLLSSEFGVPHPEKSLCFMPD